MLDFNKRKPSSQDEDTAERAAPAASQGTGATASERTASSASRRESAIIGPSIHIDGDLRGEEDLIIEGEVKGTVNLKKHALTIGGKGKVTADVYANSIAVDGFMEGDLFGAERVSIRKTAVVRGNVTSPRVSLEDGAKFRGSIEMDGEALQKVFADVGDDQRSRAGQSGAQAGASAPGTGTTGAKAPGSGSPTAAGSGGGSRS